MRLFIIVFIAIAVTLSAQDSKKIKPVNTDKFGVAAKGYDVVAYFTADKATPGKAEISHKWNGAKWYFADEEHRRMFVDNPRQYAPQYGGYCAWAVSRDYTADADPKAWKVVADENGKRRLYLNYNAKVKKHWQQEMQKNIALADANWLKMFDKEK